MNFSDFKRKFYYFVGKNNKSLHAIYDALYISGIKSKSVCLYRTNLDLTLIYLPKFCKKDRSRMLPVARAGCWVSCKKFLFANFRSQTLPAGAAVWAWVLKQSWRSPI